LASETFLRNGEQYLGYLNASAIIDGAGRVSNTLQAAEPQAGPEGPKQSKAGIHQHPGIRRCAFHSFKIQ